MVDCIKESLKEIYDSENVLNNITCKEDFLTNEQKKSISNLISNIEICLFETQKNKNFITYGFNCKEKEKIFNVSRINCDLNIQKFSNTSIYYYLNNFTGISPVLKKLLSYHQNFISNINNYESEELENSMVKINNAFKKILPDLNSTFIINKDLGMVSYPQIRLYNFKIIIVYRNIEENKVFNYTINFNKANQKAFIKDEDTFTKKYEDLKKLFFWLNKNSSKKKCKLYPSHGTIQKTYVVSEAEKAYLKNIKDELKKFKAEVLIMTNLHFEGEMIYFIKNKDEYKDLIGDEEEEDSDIIKKQKNFLETLKKQLKFLEDTSLKPEEDFIEIEIKKDLNYLDESLKLYKNTNLNKKKSIESDEESEIESEADIEKKNNSLSSDIESSEEEKKKNSSKK